MKRARSLLGTMLFTAGATLVALVAACGDDGGDGTSTSSGSGGTSGTSGGTSGGGTSGASGGFGTSGGGTSGGASGNNGDASFNPDGACAATNVGAQRTPANILFIIDKSRSMLCNVPPITTSAACETAPARANAGEPSKWEITRDALKAAIAAMPSTHSAGITYFNTDNDCGVKTAPDVPVRAVDAAHITAVNASLDGVSPNGLTPIVGGVLGGYQHLHAESTVSGKKVLVVLTDGSETCAPGQVQDFIERRAKDALSVGISTFVIGAPGSENSRAVLSQLAFNGGTARSATCNHGASPANEGDCHFDLTNASTNLAAELNAALDTITKSALGCEFDVPTGSGPIDYNKVNVVYKPSSGADKTIFQDARTCSEADGWQYTPDRKRIVLCGPACTTAKSDPNGSVSIALGCQTQSIPK